MFDFILDWFSNKKGLDELSRRLGIPAKILQKTDVSYRAFQLRKKTNGHRVIKQPNDQLKLVQKRILKRLLQKLKTHPCATAFKRNLSFVDNARCHQCQEVVIRFDLVRFFDSTSARKVRNYFQVIGWNRQASNLLARLTTTGGSLPQGAPTSPAISNLVNYTLDLNLSKIANNYDCVYTRYADDITFSSSSPGLDVHSLIAEILRVIRASGYLPHMNKKFDVRRSHQCQIVTGLVVNERANLTRKQRRRLRAIEHRFANPGGPEPTISKEQLQGWQSLVAMINKYDD